MRRICSSVTGRGLPTVLNMCTSPRLHRRDSPARPEAACRSAAVNESAASAASGLPRALTARTACHPDRAGRLQPALHGWQTFSPVGASNIRGAAHPRGTGECTGAAGNYPYHNQRAESRSTLVRRSRRFRARSSRGADLNCPRLQMTVPTMASLIPSSRASCARVLRWRCHSRIAATCSSVSFGCRPHTRILDSPLEYGRIARTRGSAWRSAAVQTRATARLAERFLREGLDGENAMRNSRVQATRPRVALPLSSDREDSDRYASDIAPAYRHERSSVGIQMSP